MSKLGKCTYACTGPSKTLRPEETLVSPYLVALAIIINLIKFNKIKFSNAIKCLGPKKKSDYDKGAWRIIQADTKQARKIF